MAFKLGKEKRGFNIPENATTRRTPLESGTLGQANNDGTIDIDPSVNPNSIEGAGILAHEQKHQLDMKMGRADYGDNWIMWEDKIYLRRTINGQDVIDGPNGRWPEGHEKHPWEAEAMAVENIVMEMHKNIAKEDKKNKKGK